MAQLKRRLPNGKPEIDIDDLADISEIITVDAENERRAIDSARKEAEAKRG